MTKKGADVVGLPIVAVAAGSMEARILRDIS